MDFEQLFRRLYPSLFRYLHRLTGDPDAADDIAQESFARLLRQPLPDGEAKPWLFTVATNLVRDAARKTARRERILASVRPTSPAPITPDVSAERSERIAFVREALAQLSERDRTLLLMRGEGFTYEEMARAVGVSPASIGTLLARALRRFSAVYRLQEVADEPHP
ncbi:MAG TPA: sigma-70 family RNA polymerase sigma factor [Longimicrobiales bacterium]